MEFSQRTTQTATDWEQWVSRNVTIRDGGIELAEASTATEETERATEGVCYRQFDAESEAVQWHRLTVDHHQTTGDTQVRVSYFASDEVCPLDRSLSAVCGLSESVLEAAAIQTSWELLASDPSKLTAHSNQSTATVRNAQQRTLSALEATTEGRWQTADATEDILLAAARGRYLTVRLELIGSEQISPRVEAVRASWPRQSYLQYLPEIYQKEATDGFLEQFLAVFGTLFTDLEREIETVTALFDPQAVPADALPWLAEWLGVETPEEWPTPAVRDRLAAAPDHQPTRGTKDGLRNMLALYLSHVEPAAPLGAKQLVPTQNTAVGMDVDMASVDHGLWILDAADRAAIRPTLRDAYDDASVIVYAGPFERPAHKRALETIIARQTPAHVTYRLVELDTQWRLGANSFLGETSRLEAQTFELGGTRLGSTAELD